MEIAVGAVDGGRGIVAGDPVLGHQGGDGGVAVLIEQGVVAHAQAQTDVQLGLGPVEQLGLGDGVAHGLLQQLQLDGAQPVGTLGEDGLGGDPGLSLGDGAGFADHGDHLKAVFPQHPVHNGGLLVQSAAEAQAQAGIAHAVGELHNLPQAGPLAVAHSLDGGAVDEEIVVFRLAVFLQHLLEVFRVPHRTVFGELVQLTGFTGGNGALGTGKHRRYTPFLFKSISMELRKFQRADRLAR